MGEQAMTDSPSDGIPGDVPAVEPAVETPTAAIAGDTGLKRFGQIAKTVALLSFLLPWVTISCAGQTVASVSGVRLATGLVSVRNPMNNAMESHNGSPDWLVLLAAAAIAAALAISFVLVARKAATAGLALCAAAALLSIYAVLVRIPGEVTAGFRSQQAANAAGNANAFAASM